MIYMILFPVFLVSLATVTNYSIRSWWVFYLSALVPLSLLKFPGVSLSNSSNQVYPFSLDMFSLGFVFLSVVVIVLSILSGMKHIKHNFVMHLVLMTSILLSLILFFFSLSFFLFFFFFEFPLIPMALIISIWGSQSERLMANYYFMMYTIVSSIPLLVSMMWVVVVNSWSYNIILMENFMAYGSVLILMFLVAFLCKLPIYSFHLWLPKAHVEAPVSGSMVLAGLLLKMGGFGVMRFVLVVDYVLGFFMDVLVMMTLLSAAWSLAMCYRQVDLKSFIAFSSVSHMSFSFVGVMLSGMLGLKGGFLLFLSHGLVSPAMFYSANLLYERVESRMMLSMKSFQMSLGGMGFILLLVVLANMSFPPTINFFSEICLYISLVSYNVWYALMSFIIFLLGSVVMLLMYSKLIRSGGTLSARYMGLNMREMVIMLVHVYYFVLMTVVVSVL